MWKMVPAPHALQMYLGEHHQDHQDAQTNAVPVVGWTEGFNLRRP